MSELTATERAIIHWGASRPHQEFTEAEAAERFGLQPRTAQRLLCALHKKGLLGRHKRTTGKQRKAIYVFTVGVHYG